MGDRKDLDDYNSGLGGSDGESEDATPRSYPVPRLNPLLTRRMVVRPNAPPGGVKDPDSDEDVYCTTAMIPTTTLTQMEHPEALT